MGWMVCKGCAWPLSIPTSGGVSLQQRQQRRDHQPADGARCDTEGEEGDCQRHRYHQPADDARSAPDGELD